MGGVGIRHEHFAFPTSLRFLLVPIAPNYHTPRVLSSFAVPRGAAAILVGEPCWISEFFDGLWPLSVQKQKEKLPFPESLLPRRLLLLDVPCSTTELALCP